MNANANSMPNSAPETRFFDKAGAGKERSRAAFEDAVYQSDLVHTLFDPSRSHFAFDAREVLRTRSMERNEDDYHGPEVSAMWFGWRLHEAYARKQQGATEKKPRVVAPARPSNADLPINKRAQPYDVKTAWVEGAQWAHDRLIEKTNLHH